MTVSLTLRPILIHNLLFMSLSNLNYITKKQFMFNQKTSLIDGID